MVTTGRWIGGGGYLVWYLFIIHHVGLWFLCCRANGTNESITFLNVAPSIPTQLTLPAPTNVLYVSVEKWPITAAEGEDTDTGGEGFQQVVCATGADRRVNFFALKPSFPLANPPASIQDSPVLSCVSLQHARDFVTISSSMSGQVMVYDHTNRRILDERRDHKKYVVRIAVFRAGDGTTLIATAGWDAKVFVYRMLDVNEGKLGQPIASVMLATNPESIVFVVHPQTSSPVLLISRRDSTSLLYYKLPVTGNETPSSSSEKPDLELLGTQNLAPHSIAWVAFSPSCLALSPTDPTLLAVATSTVPHMKLLIVRLLFPPISHTANTPEPSVSAVAGQARQDLARQDREEAAIQTHISTSAPQTPYSTPCVVWRPDGTGVWVNGDDGVIRGVETKSGKVVAALRDGHEAGSKIRSIWCGMTWMEGVEQECLVSGGFDHRLVVWRP